MRPREQSQSVSFRLRGRPLDRLLEEAKTTNQSLGEVARAKLLASLENDDPLRLFAEVLSLRRDVSNAGGSLERLRSDIAATLEIILVTLSKSSTEEVRSWIERNLRR